MEVGVETSVFSSDSGVGIKLTTIEPELFIVQRAGYCGEGRYHSKCMKWSAFEVSVMHRTESGLRASKYRR